MLLKEGFTTFLIDCHCGLNESAINRQQMQGKHLKETARGFFVFSCYCLMACWEGGGWQGKGNVEKYKETEKDGVWEEGIRRHEDIQR